MVSCRKSSSAGALRTENQTLTTERETLDAKQLADRATEIRRIAIALIHGAGSGHPGSCLSAADLLSALYFRVMNVRPESPDWPDADRFVLSKGHACPALYGALCLRGYFPETLLGSFRRLGGALQGSPSRGVPGVDATCGSLGQGFSIAIGLAIGHRKLERPGRVYVMLGDGELQEGEIWEGAMAASHYSLDNLCAIVDYNKMQSDDLNSRVMGIEPLRAKWEAFGWHVLDVDGHDLDATVQALETAGATRGRPTVVVAHTIKGRGVSYMAGRPSWHGSVKLRDDELAQALQDLGVGATEQRRYRFHE